MAEGALSLRQALWFNPREVLPNTSPISIRSVTTVKALAVRIVTADIDMAGTDNDVYFDIGPLGWKLDPDGPHLSSSDDPFSRGSDDTFALDLHEALLHCVPVTTADILWLRIQKKGILGYRGTGDGVDGAWAPSSIHLIVNGVEYTRTFIDQWITDDNNPVWQQTIQRPYVYSKGEWFANSLRFVANNALSAGDESIAILTTKFKIMGISGWLGEDLPLTCATGMVVREPGKSTDGLATIDLQLESIKVGDSVFVLDGLHGIHHPRFLRVEYAYGGLPPLLLGNFVPHNGQRVRICGPVEWDSDQEGWYEIHPASTRDVTLLST